MIKFKNKNATFKLCGYTFKVIVVDDLSTREKRWGDFDPNTHTIRLQNLSLCENKEAVEQTLYHELIHAIFHVMGEDKLYYNEKLVDMMASLLYQFMQTYQEQEEKIIKKRKRK